ncbi:MAG: ABC transporter permease subunit [Candidatus Symbiodolus clandestinus]
MGINRLILTRINNQPVAQTVKHGLWWYVGHRFLRHRMAVLSLILLTLLITFILLFPQLSPFPYDTVNWNAMRLHPNFASGHYLGTDNLGRDLLVRTAMGGRVSLLVGVISALMAVIIGTLYGALAGYLGGWVDRVMMRGLEILDALPFIFLVIVLTSCLGRSILLIFIAIGTVSWLNIARIVRGQVLSLKQKEFILAAHLCGVSSAAIIIRHLIPNVLGIVVVYASLLIPSMILFESFLSFLGLGVQEPMTSWGMLIQSGARSMEVNPWALLGPGSFLVLTLFCFNFISGGLRDALDPKNQSS